MGFVRIAVLGTSLAAAAGMFSAHPCRAADARKVVFDSAQFLRTDEPRPPGPGAAWRTVHLPHVWRTTDPGAAGLGWYRIEFTLASAPNGTQAIEVDHYRSTWVEYYVNGALIGGSRETIGKGGLGFGAPIFLTIPPSLLHAGVNVLMAHMSTRPPSFNIQGLGRVSFGDALPVREQHAKAQELGFYAWRSFYAMALAAGVIAFFAWLARPSDRILLWYSMACLSWVLAGAVWNVIRFLDLPKLNIALLQVRQYGLAVPSAIISLRIAGIRRIWFERLLWCFLATEVGLGVVPVFGPLLTETLVMDGINAALLLAGAAIIVRAGRRPLRWPDAVAAASLLAMGGLILFQPARFFGWVDIESPILRPYHVPVLIFAIGAAIFDRHVRAIWRMEQSNVELERRVGEKAREIEAFHAEREERSREEALVRDRQRILADMHDGLGASLVGLLRYAQSGAAQVRGLEMRVTEALQELRIAVDALEPAEGDLGTVLGKLRHRIEPLVEAAGARLAWNAEELPPVPALDSAAVFGIQRVVLQAVSNAIQHAGAREICIETRAEGTDAIAVTVRDDGKGFDPLQPSKGLGLANMRTRAGALGGTLDIAPAPGGGTRVTLRIPVNLGQTAPRARQEAAIATRA